MTGLEADLKKCNLKKQSQFAGEVEPAQSIPKAFGFEAATIFERVRFEKTKPISGRSK